MKGTRKNILHVLAITPMVGVCAVYMLGCASPVFSSRFSQVNVNGTNCVVHIHLAVDGGATVIPQVGIAAGDQATSNLAHEAAGALEMSSGIGAASAAAGGIGKGVATIAAIKALPDWASLTNDRAAYVADKASYTNSVASVPDAPTKQAIKAHAAMTQDLQAQINDLKRLLLAVANGTTNSAVISQ